MKLPVILFLSTFLLCSAKLHKPGPYIATNRLYTGENINHQDSNVIKLENILELHNQKKGSAVGNSKPRNAGKISDIVYTHDLNTKFFPDDFQRILKEKANRPTSSHDTSNHKRHINTLREGKIKSTKRHNRPKLSHKKRKAVEVFQDAFIPSQTHLDLKYKSKIVKINPKLDTKDRQRSEQNEAVDKTFELTNNRMLRSDNDQKLDVADVNEITRTANLKGNRQKRDVTNSVEANVVWKHSEYLDTSGDVLLRWATTESEIVFRLEAKGLGYIGLGFNSQATMVGADIVVGWVDDSSGNVQILDCVGMEHNQGVMSDDVQSYELLAGTQNGTHTALEFRRQLDTCDPQDYIIGEDTIHVLWSVGGAGSDGQLPRHAAAGARPLRLLRHFTRPRTTRGVRHWDVTLNDLTIPLNAATQFWCKVFRAPELPRKHHIIGYEPLLRSRAPGPKDTHGPKTQDPRGPSPVHHMVLYECAQDPYVDRQMWNTWAEGNGFYGPSRPKEWASCLTPVAAWATGSQGEFFPENVGLPLGEQSGVSYYMLEVHYDNTAMHEVIDSSGIRIHYTAQLRLHDAALLGSGVGVSALHVVPPRQPAYRSVGICSPKCTHKMLPESGVNIVSVLLHAHGTAKKIALKHIRGDQELPRISEENNYDVGYQQARTVPGGRQFRQGDTLLTECTYDSRNRSRPILGGYSSVQEMCLSFVVYYPRTELAGCYSTTPAKEFFETFGVKEFYSLSMLQIENLFLGSGSLDAMVELEAADSKLQLDDEAADGGDQGVSLLSSLVIKEPAEFRNKSLMAHLSEMPWAEPLLSRPIQDSLYAGTHLTFCKRRDDSLAIPVEFEVFPTFSELINNDTTNKSCHYKMIQSPATIKSAIAAAPSHYSSFLLTLFSLCAYVVR